MSFLSLPEPGWGSDVFCPRTLPRSLGREREKKVQLAPRTPGLRVKQFNNEPRGTPSLIITLSIIQVEVEEIRNLTFFGKIPAVITYIIPKKNMTQTFIKVLKVKVNNLICKVTTNINEPCPDKRGLHA